jgi:hypothetical protein
MQGTTAISGSTARSILTVLVVIGVLAGCGTGDPETTGRRTPTKVVETPSRDGSPSTVSQPEHGVDVEALTAETVCEAVAVDTVAAITGRQVSAGDGELGACEWKAPEAVRVRLFPPGEWSPDSGADGYRELSGIGSEAYVASGTFGNGYEAEALLDDRAVAAIIPADWATEDMAVALLRAAVERLG